MAGRKIVIPNPRQEVSDSIDVQMFAAAERSGSFFSSPAVDRYRAVRSAFDRDDLFEAASAARRIPDDHLAKQIEAYRDRYD